MRIERASSAMSRPPGIRTIVAVLWRSLPGVGGFPRFAVLAGLCGSRVERGR